MIIDRTCRYCLAHFTHDTHNKGRYRIYCSPTCAREAKLIYNRARNARDTETRREMAKWDSYAEGVAKGTGLPSRLDDMLSKPPKPVTTDYVLGLCALLVVIFSYLLWRAVL